MDRRHAIAERSPKNESLGDSPKNDRRRNPAKKAKNTQRNEIR